ncbi:MAG: PrgI family protein [Candidatus Moranbacteria bacterium]|jgi:hypothetical protein|nr:PrgI family protein [Candidatus Moranbacteria bacterium]
MLINVPQYIDVEDKVAGPLTMKQLGWVIVLGIILLIMWNTMPSIVFFIIGFPITVLFVALAFYRPYGQPLGNFVIFGIMYYFRPKIYVWKRTPDREPEAQKTIQVNNVHVVEKKVTAETLKELAQLLDSEGVQHSGHLESILKEHNTKK